MSAADGGPFRGSYAVAGGIAEALPVDLLIPGCPPTPAQVLEGLLALLRAGGAAPAPPPEKGQADASPEETGPVRPRTGDTESPGSQPG